MRNLPTEKFLFVLISFILLNGCASIPSFSSAQSYPPDPLALRYDGTGEKLIPLKSLSGPMIIHLVAENGKTPFQASLKSEKGTIDFNERPGKVDVYRGYEFDPKSPAFFQTRGDSSWSITISPANPAYFTILNIPGKYSGSRNAVLSLQGEYGVATFRMEPKQDFSAWAFGPGEVNQELFITPSGDYKGKSVLPQGTKWIIVSSNGSWSVDIQAPCCKAPPGYKPTYNQ
jgi:hypothetical protein